MEHTAKLCSVLRQPKYVLLICRPIILCNRIEISACIFELSFLGAFANLQKATISFSVSVREPESQPARIELLVSYAMDFHEI